MKPISFHHISKIAQTARSTGQTIVLVTGVFDLLHPEHLHFLSQAKQIGDILIIGIESDQRVKKLKGPQRPINSESIRQLNLLFLNFTPYVFILPSKFDTYQDHQNLIQSLKPHILAVSSHTSHLDVKKQILSQHGGKVVIVRQHNPHISSTILLAQAKTAPIFHSQIIPGKGRGRNLGFPTLNLTIPSPGFSYPHGIYAGFVIHQHQRYPGAFHYGPIPTFNDINSSLEVHVLDHHFSPLPDRISFQFTNYLRPVKSFSTPRHLADRIKKDIDLTQQLLNR